jgi:alkylation response protein AidB-like acyl-CoA dehydrogenase
VAGATLADTVEYTQQRAALGQPVAGFQNTRFRLADMSTELDVTRVFVDQTVLAYNEGELTAVDAAKAKYHPTGAVPFRQARDNEVHG